jgi:serine/threonine protein phosphatase PrpC
VGIGRKRPAARADHGAGLAKELPERSSIRGRQSPEKPMSVNVTVYAQTDIGLVRKSNEDAFAISDLTSGSLIGEKRMERFQVGARGVLLAVSDGMGGHKAGEVASALVVESLQRSMANKAGKGACDAVLENATIQANRDVWQAARYPGREHMGATLTALFIHDKTAYIAEVGDSRAYLLRGGEITQVTHDQSYVQLLVDSGAMSPSEAKVSPLGNVVLQAMGLKPEVSVALGKLDLRQRDCLILCSDGLSNKLSADELRHVILTSPRLDTACMRLIDEAKRRGGDDNITTIVAGVDGDLPPMTSGENIAETFFVLREFHPAPSRSAPQ